MNDKVGELEVSDITPMEHRRFASALYNYTWNLMEQTDKSPEDVERMINSAHASLFHWTYIGLPENLSKGEWLISRAYSIAGRTDSALFHGLRALKIAIDNDLRHLDKGFGYEALARVYSMKGRTRDMQENLDLGYEEARQVKSEEERNLLLQNLRSVPYKNVPI